MIGGLKMKNLKCSKMNCEREAITMIGGSLICEYHRDAKDVLVHNTPKFTKRK